MIRPAQTFFARPGFARSSLKHVFVLTMGAALWLASANVCAQAEQSSAKSGSLMPGGNSKQPISVEADKLDYLDKEQKAIYTGNVVARQGDSTLRCRILTIYIDKTSSDKTATSPTENSQIKRMEAAGPVTVTQKDQIGTGDNGAFDKGKNELVLTGHVSLAQGKNITTGDKLTYDLTSGQALVSSGASQSRVKSSFVPGSAPKDQK